MIKPTLENLKFKMILIDLFNIVNFPIINKFVKAIHHLMTSYDRL